MQSPLIEKYINEKRWVNWKLVPVKDKDGNVKHTKVPYQTKTVKAKSNDPLTWNTYEAVSTAADNGSNGFAGVGIMLHDGKLICIDIDHVVEDGKVKHAQADIILALLKKANTFTEISQSGTGLHIFLECTTPFVPLANKKAPFEVYADVRFIATTNNPFNKAIPVRTVDEAEILQILSIIGYPWGKGTDSTESVKQISHTMPDEEVLERMFASKNGEDIKKLYEGDTTKYDDDESRADMALLSTLAFWTGKNATQMEVIWRSSPLGQRKKTQGRAEYRKRSIDNAIAACKNVYTPRGVSTVNTEFLTQWTKAHGEVIIPCKENVLIALRITDGLAGTLRYNEWLDTKEVLTPKKEWRRYEDNDKNLIQTILAQNYPDYALRTASDSYVINAVLQYCKENAVDPAKEYFESLVWDQKPRLHEWIQRTYNTIGYEKEYEAFGTQWLKALVKRVCVPGCKFDNVLVLEGKQGIKKSTSFRVLAEDWYAEITTNPNNKDFFMLMQGKTIVEFSEGELQDKASDKLLKSIITTQIDAFRSPYGREIEERPRRCVFAMTTNDAKYLKDSTGNRRWLPVSCVGEVNIDWLKENREQLYAEAYHRAVTFNENLYDGLNTETVKEMQDDRRQERFEETKIIDWYYDRSQKEREEGYTLEEVYDMAIGKGEERMNQLHNVIIPPILKNTLRLETVRRIKDGKRRVLYIPTEETTKRFPPVTLF
jgi:putative DNA primase/helicase